MKKKFLVSLCGAFLIGAISISPITVVAQTHGFGVGQGRTDPININDFSTSVWDRFSFNYAFTSGMDYSADLGRPTTFTGDVHIDPFTVNIRRDANVALLPPAYGVFSGHVATMPSNLLFPQPTLWQHARFTENPHMLPMFDTLQLGVNAGSSGTLLGDTSMGRSDLQIAGLGGITNYVHGTRNDMQITNTTPSSSVILPVSNDLGGFLMPTSVR